MKTPSCNNPDEYPVAGKQIWLCLYFASLALEVFTRSRPPEENMRPIVVHVRQRVMFLNAIASETGIQPGNSVDTAYTLNAQVVSVERNSKKEARALNQLANWCYQFTPTVCIKTENSLLLEVGGCLKLFDGLGNLVELIRQGLVELGYCCQIANAPTPLSALLLAKASHSTGFKALPQIAKKTSARPRLAATSDPRIIYQVPVSYMEIDERIIQSLHNMGIRHMKELLVLPTSSLGKRFGKPFIDYLDRLTGRKPDPQQVIEPDPDFFSELHFLTDITNLQSLVFPMQRLLVELACFLTSRQLVVDRFSWRFRHKNHPAKTMLVCIASPDNNQQMFLTLTRLQLERFKNIREVDSLALIATDFSSAQQQNDDLFRGNGFNLESEQQMTSAPPITNNLLLNMLRARLGPRTCFGLSQANDHRPEKAWKLIQLNQKDYWTPPFNCPDNPRPTYLLKIPEPLKATQTPDKVPGAQSSPRLFQFFHETIPVDMELLQGPERIDCDWWGQDSPRDYFIARHRSGTTVWVFRHLKNSSWYLHGIFS
jgi:protein ImuB